MTRAFISVILPDGLRGRLAMLAQMLPLPRRVPEEDLHVTLAFLGDVPDPLLEEVHYELEAITGPAPGLQVTGLDMFGHPRPRQLHAALAPDPALVALQGRVSRAVRGAGVTLDARRFVPHVTLGRFPHGGVDMAPLERALAQMAGVTMVPERGLAFALFSSTLTPDGPIYEELARYPLR